MDKTGGHLPAVFLGLKEFTDGPMPLKGKIEAGELVSIHESFYGLFHLVLLGMVIHPDLLPESVVPKAIHDMHDGLLKGIVTDHDRAEHSLMPGRMDTVIDREGKIDGDPHLLRPASDGLGD